MLSTKVLLKFINLAHAGARFYSNHCVCVCVRVSVCVSVCVSVTTLASATNALKAKVRYQQKALDARNKINVGIELKILGSKVMTVTSLPWNLYLALTAGNRR